MILGRIFKDPFVHFAVLSAAVFAYFHSLDPSQDVAQETISFSSEDIQIFAFQMEKTLGRPPTAQDVAQYLDQLVTEEALVREAVTLNMDQGDAIIRQRLVQKMRFMVDGAARATVPQEGELRAFYDENRSKYVTPPTFTFDQVFLGKDGDVVEMIAALARGVAPADVGEGTALPPDLRNVSERQVEGVFGRGFAAALPSMPVGSWEGPVTSAFGQHAVRVTAAAPEVVPMFEDVQAAVLTDWQQQQAVFLQREMLTELVAKYIVILPEEAEIAAVLAK